MLLMWHWSRGMYSERNVAERPSPGVSAWVVRSRRRREFEWQSVRERDRGRGKCLPFCMPLKESIVPGVPLRMPTSKPSAGHHLAAASIDHLQSFIPPIKILSVHITFVFLCWTLLLLHKDTLKECLWAWCILCKSRRNYSSNNAKPYFGSSIFTFANWQTNSWKTTFSLLLSEKPDKRKQLDCFYLKNQTAKKQNSSCPYMINISSLLWL